jgi:predicted small secreted protein
MLAAPLLTAACNTIAGLGKDVQAVGDAMTNSADDAKN